MDFDELEALRAIFLKLAVPEFNADSTCYLSSASALELSAESFVQVYNLGPDHFPSAQDFRRAQETNSLWSWEERGSGGDVLNGKAASSLEKLLGHLGQPHVQGQACALFENLYPAWSLCYNDFKEAGWERVDDFVKDQVSVHSAFDGDEGDLAKARATNQLWTIVDTFNSKTVWASHSLEGVLTRAWDNHPVIVQRQRLMGHVGMSSRPSSRRF